MVSKSGHAVRFKEEQARPMGRGTAGVKGMNVADKGNRVLSLDVVGSKDKTGELLVVTENGYGKRTLIEEYPVKGRGTKGVLTIKLTAKKGQLAGAMIVRAQDELVFISQNGMVQRTTAAEISQQGRATQGVRVMNLKSKDRVSAVALVAESAAAAGNGNGASRSAPSLEQGTASSSESAEAGAAGNGKPEIEAPTSKRAPRKAASKPRPADKAKPSAKAKPAAKKAPSKPRPAARTRPKRVAKPKPKAAARPKPAAKAKPKGKKRPNPGTVRGQARRKRS
jgi:hypothetical protein